MSVEPEQLEWLLDTVNLWDVAALWDAKTREQLDDATTRSMGAVWAWSVPRHGTGLPSDQEHARASLIAYVLASTMHLRQQEFWDLV